MSRPMHARQWVSIWIAMGVTVVVLLLCDPVVAQQRRAPAAEQGPKQVTVAVAISSLRRELLDPRRTPEDGWPREEANFAQEKGWTVDQEQMKRAFLRPLDQDPTIDAYIRWQMLSFEPDFASYSAEEFQRVIATMPDYWRQPEVLFQQTREGVTMTFQSRAGIRGPRPVVGAGAIGFNPSLSFVGGGTMVGGNTQGFAFGEDLGNPQVVEERRRTEVRQANAQLQIQRQSVDRMNELISRYRAALTERLPEEAGVRLRAKFRDTAGLLEAGDERMHVALDELIAMAVSQRDNATITPELRVQMADWARGMDQTETVVVQSLSYDAAGWAVNLVDRKRLDRDQLGRLLDAVR